jgi:NADPH:quinone reductase-like Zn-dependent oxidoreductase
MRKGEWAEAATVSGIECVGVVKACPGGEFAPGTKVVGLYGRVRQDHQRQLRRAHQSTGNNIIPVHTDMPWEDLAVIPESYATAGPAAAQP